MLDMEMCPGHAMPEVSSVDRGKMPAVDLAGHLAALPLMSHAELRAEWRRLFRAHPPQRIGRDVLELGVAWKLQERGLGGLGAATKRRVSELAEVMERKGDLARTRALRLRPGARLMRGWGGETHDVFVTESGFLWRGKSWRSLSAIAREITGTHWSGPRFFGLVATEKRGARDSSTADPRAADEEGDHA